MHLLPAPYLQTTVPKSFPMPAVSAIAKAPQNVTRAVARNTFAPPVFAPIAPSRARKPRDAADTMGTSAPAGDTTTMSKGMAAPTENVTADVSAACTGRALVIFEIPSSSRACAVRGIFRRQLLRDLPRKRLVDATLDVDFGKFIQLVRRILAQLRALAREIRLFGVGLRADRHILAGRHRHGPRHQACDTGDQDIVLLRRCRGNADDQARGRDNTVVSAEHRGAQPADAVDEVVLRMEATTLIRNSAGQITAVP